MNAEFWVAVFAAGVALIALISSAVSAARARVKTIEDAYIARYWQILDGFPSLALVAEDGTACSSEELKAVRLYLRLCEDELELRELGWVGGETWEQWRPGIRAQLNQWPVAAEWALIRDCHRAPHQFMLLRELDATPDYDPYRHRPYIGRFTRQWRGL
ncbi:hypothetical protein C6376_32115 [Streptomyces sp. P3]|uniref:hypothetical protein n=1 Tax=Streptomyces TaxID=1883 RepID=UPI000D1BF291|nr:hypothetical protein [Streptomyces sp. P3]AVV45318.1 hypothetical protein C6376_32115 [Streptomyces sp. P3]